MVLPQIVESLLFTFKWNTLYLVFIDFVVQNQSHLTKKYCGKFVGIYKVVLGVILGFKVKV